MVQEVADLVRHDADEGFAMVEHGWIALVDDHADLLVAQILARSLACHRIIVADEKAGEMGATLLVRHNILAKVIPRDFWPRALLTVNQEASTEVKKMFAWAPNVQFSLVRNQGASSGVHFVALITLPDESRCLRNLNAIVKFLRGTLATSIFMPMLPRVALSSGIPMPLTLTFRPRARPSGRAVANSAVRRRSN